VIYERHITETFLESVEDSPVSMLAGARQTGKSTFCENILAKHVAAEYITLDDITTLAAAKNNPGSFLRGLSKIVIIDEVQRAPDLFIPLKSIVDKERENRRFILTGSANVLALPKISESLAGRMEIHSLWPLSQGEISGRRERFIDTILNGKMPEPGDSIDWNSLALLLHRGGYPEAQKRQSESRRDKWFASYLSSILQKDIRDLANIEGLTEIPNLLSFIAGRVSSLLNFSELSRISGIPNTTLKRYYTLLKNVFLVVELPAWHSNLDKRLVKAPKVYLNDTGLLCHLLGLSQTQLDSDTTAAGPILENFIVAEILKQISWAERRARLYHFRTSKGQEVDLVLETGDKKIVGVEIKRSASVSPSDFKGLKVLKDLSGKQFNAGFVLYTGDLAVRFDDDLFALPVSAIWA